jgi:thiol-disulfide isomerase/thioredoxin
MIKFSSIKKSTGILLIGLVAVLVLSACAEKTYAFTENEDNGSVVLYFFWGDGCPHCATAKPVLVELNNKYPELAIRSYEVWYVESNRALYTQMADKYGVPQNGRGVPLFLLGDTYWIGWSDSIQEEITAKIESCMVQACPDAGAGIMPGASSEIIQSQPGNTAQIDPQAKEINFFGNKINLERQSLFISTLLISFVDGVNPCSVWVLTMLLALTLHTGSRKKVLVIGFIFLTVTAAVYAMFITGLFTFFSIVSFATWIQAIVALVAVFFAAVNIKDYFWYKEGISFTISDENKPGIFHRMRKVMDASQSFWGMAGATVVLAAGVSLVEFSCTAGFPVLWTNLLTSQKVTASVFILLLLLYMIIYQFDEMVIFLTAVTTLKASKLEEKHGRILKLIGGMLMLTLGLVMLINPTYMNSLSGSLLVFGITLALILLVLLVHRKILPAYGIWIGTEAEGKRKVARKKNTRKAARH